MDANEREYMNLRKPHTFFICAYLFNIDREMSLAHRLHRRPQIKN